MIPRLLIAGLLGGLAMLAVTPGWAWPNLMPLAQFASLGGLAFLVLQAATGRQAFFLGLSYGAVLFLTGVAWIVISLQRYGGMHPALAVFGLVALCAYLMLYPAFWALMSQVLMRRLEEHTRWVWPLGAASLWALLEALRGWLLSGFPWLHIAYAHVDGLLAAWGPLGGVQAIAWVAALVSCAIALALHRPAQRLRQWAVVGACLVLSIGVGSLQWVSPHGEPLNIRLVQGNIAMDQKFEDGAVQKQMSLHQQLALQGLATTPAAHIPQSPALPFAQTLRVEPPQLPQADSSQPSIAQARRIPTRPDLVLMPETVVPVFPQQLTVADWLDWEATVHWLGVPIALGVPLIERTTTHSRITNSVVLLQPGEHAADWQQGRFGPRYDKMKLVPFGEFVPQGFQWFVDRMVMPLSNFSPGQRNQAPFLIGDQRLAFNICYEDVFGALLLPGVRGLNGPHIDGATILASSSNLAWFGESHALGQSLQMARMRALETGRPLVRATNTGITAAIDHRGRVQDQLPTADIGVLDVQVQGYQGLTPYTRWSDWPALLWAAFWLVLGLRLARRR